MMSSPRRSSSDHDHAESEDDDLDLDFDLDELDPRAPPEYSSLAESVSGRRPRRRPPYAPAIALRSLRGNNNNNNNRSTWRNSDDNVDGDGYDDDDDFHHDEEDNRRSSTTGTASAPLLQQGRQRSSHVRNASNRFMAQLRKLRRSSYFSQESSHQRLPSHAPSTAATNASSAREIPVAQPQTTKFPPNIISNAKYTAWSFLPRTLYNEFSFFFNVYFLLVALSQTIPVLRIGYMSSYIAPLAFVLTISLGKEAYDDIIRRRRDAEANAEEFTVVSFQEPPTLAHTTTNSAVSRPGAASSSGEQGVYEVTKKSRDLKVGDILKLKKNQRFPADTVILKSISTDSALDENSVSPSKAQHPASLIHSNDMSLSNPGHLEVPPNKHDGSSSIAEEDEDEDTDEAAGSTDTFIRTDQLDGETDWKLRIPLPLTQKLPLSDYRRLRITASAPTKSVHDFVGKLEVQSAFSKQYDPDPHESSASDAASIDGAGDAATAGTTGGSESSPLNIDNTAWANTVLASNTATYAAVIYTGSETKSAMSTSPSRSKTGLLEHEINSLTKVLCILTLLLSVTLVGLERFEPTNDKPWYIAILMYLILFSTIIPMSLRVNLDMAKSAYASYINKDAGIPGALVRTSTIPEDLGRVEYLLSDKTGTLTRNEMELMKIHVGTVSYANEAMEEVASYIRHGFAAALSSPHAPSLFTASTINNTLGPVQMTRTRREIGSRVRSLILALALCHNVTPTREEVGDSNDNNGGETTTTTTTTSYQASSPDEIAIVQYTEEVGLRLAHRDRHRIVLRSVDTGRVVISARILEVLPFTSESKRMGIVVRFERDRASRQRQAQRQKQRQRRKQKQSQSASASQAADDDDTDNDGDFYNDDYGDGDDGDGDGEDEDEIWFYQKGADTVMSSIVTTNDWLDEETANMAREGLRTLVVGRKRLVREQYHEFAAKYKQASLSLTDRDGLMAAVVQEYLEHGLELLGVTGVEDKLQTDVKPSLELLRDAGIKIWMLTGDKVETARCVAVSSKLVARGQHIHTISKAKDNSSSDDMQEHLDFLRDNRDSCLLIDGESLTLMLSEFRDEFIAAAVTLPAVIACRCSPTQKAEIALLIRKHTRKRVCCIGDGGNDVSMIQAADVGLGIVGKEGRQASLAADFSITSFHHLTKLFFWHGRNSYKRSAKLAQFIMHRGVIVSVCQAVFSIASKFDPKGLFINWLLVGYATIYTSGPVFSLVLDRDVDEYLANLYPELYKELKLARSLSYRSFFRWLLVSLYQGAVIQGLAQLLLNAVAGPRLISASFTALILNELLMVAISVTTWHPIMIFSILATAAVYFISVPFLGDYFDLGYVITLGFLWRVVAVTAAALVPVWAVQLITTTVNPPSYRKIRG